MPLSLTNTCGPRCTAAFPFAGASRSRTRERGSKVAVAPWYRVDVYPGLFIRFCIPVSGCAQLTSAVVSRCSVSRCASGVARRWGRIWPAATCAEATSSTATRRIMRCESRQRAGAVVFLVDLRVPLLASPLAAPGNDHGREHAQFVEGVQRHGEQDRRVHHVTRREERADDDDEHDRVTTVLRQELRRDDAKGGEREHDDRQLEAHAEGQHHREDKPEVILGGDEGPERWRRKPPPPPRGAGTEEEERQP